MKRIAVFSYGALCYLMFLATFVYAVLFLGNFGLSRTLDGEATAGFWQALLINALLLGVFAVQHSVMARPAFKRWWTRFVPKPVERSTYVLFSGLALLLLFYAWQPMGGTLWDVRIASGAAWSAAFFWGRLAAGTRRDVPDQSLRPVRPAAGVAEPARPASE